VGGRRIAAGLEFRSADFAGCMVNDWLKPQKSLVFHQSVVYQANRYKWRWGSKALLWR